MGRKQAGEPHGTTYIHQDWRDVPTEIENIDTEQLPEIKPMPQSPSWTIEQIEGALMNAGGNLGVHDGVKYAVTRTSDEGGGYRFHVSIPCAASEIVHHNVRVYLKPPGVDLE